MEDADEPKAKRERGEGNAQAQVNQEGDYTIGFAINSVGAMLTVPEIDLSKDKWAPLGEFPPELLAAGRKKELENLVSFGG